METNMFALIATLGTSVVGACVGAYMSSRFGYRQGALTESDRRRREAADAVIPQLIELRRLLRNAETSRTTTEWAKVTEASYEALDDARHLLPLGLKHLKHSIRTSVGEAMGPVAMADIDPEMLEYGLSPYDHRWTSYAIDYLNGALDHIRAWRDARSSQVSALSMRDYDDWLAHTNRYRSGA
jgi:hypothetical protein